MSPDIFESKYWWDIVKDKPKEKGKIRKMYDWWSSLRGRALDALLRWEIFLNTNPQKIVDRIRELNYSCQRNKQPPETENNDESLDQHLNELDKWLDEFYYELRCVKRLAEYKQTIRSGKPRHDEWASSYWKENINTWPLIAYYSVVLGIDQDHFNLRYVEKLERETRSLTDCLKELYKGRILIVTCGKLKRPVFIPQGIGGYEVQPEVQPPLDDPLNFIPLSKIFEQGRFEGYKIRFAIDAYTARKRMSSPELDLVLIDHDLILKCCKTYNKEHSDVIKYIMGEYTKNEGYYSRPPIFFFPIGMDIPLEETTQALRAAKVFDRRKLNINEFKKTIEEYAK